VGLLLPVASNVIERCCSTSLSVVEGMEGNQTLILIGDQLKGDKVLESVKNHFISRCNTALRSEEDSRSSNAAAPLSTK
jgi:hypothetical protein